VGTVGLRVTDPGCPDARPIVALELVLRTTNHLRMSRGTLRVLLVFTNIIVTAQLFVAAVTTVSDSIALPPERHTLLIAALEHPLVANASWESRLRLVSTVSRNNQAVAFVALVGAIGISVAPPRLKDAVTIVTLELPVLTTFHLLAFVLVTVVRTVLIPVTFPGLRNTGASRNALKLSSIGPSVALNICRRRAFALVTAVLAVFFQVAFPLRVDALSVVAAELLVTAGCLRAIVLVAPVAAVVVEVALPVARDALPVAALELVVLALLPALLVVLVRVVPTVRDSVTKPGLGDAEAIAALPLVLSTLSVC